MDVILDQGLTVQPVEIKAGATLHESFFKGLDYYCHLNAATEKPVLIYGGSENQQRTRYSVIGYPSIAQLAP